MIPAKLHPFPESAWVGLVGSYRDLLADRSESPDPFHWLGFVTAFGQLCGRSVWVEYPDPVYLNVFGAVLGPTGLPKKSSSRRPALRLMDDVDPQGVRRLVGVSTGEGLVTVLSERPGTRLLIEEDELRGFFKKSHTKSAGMLMPRLCELYDAPRRVDLPTRGNPVTSVDPLVSFLSAATLESLEDAIEDNDVYGGFLNRLIPVAGEPKPPQPWPSRPDESAWQALVAEVREIVGLYTAKPRCLRIVDPAARTLWETFYRDFMAEQQRSSEQLAALASRLHVHAQKIGLFYAAQRGAGEISREDLARAVDIARSLHSVYAAVLGTLGLSKAARLEQRIADILSERPMFRRELHQRIGGRFTAPEVRRVVDDLVQLERIEEHANGMLSWYDAVNARKQRDAEQRTACEGESW